MSVLWELPRDILHSVYGEWLGWKDLSRLDVACVEKRVREVWLTSLTDLRILIGFYGCYGSKLRIFYKWMVSRRVYCVEDFLVDLAASQDLMRELDMESYCPALRSIEIENGGIESNISNISQVKSHLSDFLSHCHGLQGVSIWMNGDYSYFDIILKALVETLRENSLIKISLPNISKCPESPVLFATLLTKHASSLRDLNVCINDEKLLSLLASTLIKNQIHLRSLSIEFSHNPSQSTASLIPYLSTAGGLLDSLTVRWEAVWGSGNIDDFIVSVATWCPNLTRLTAYTDMTCSMENLRLLYEQCPHLQDLHVHEAIHTNNVSREVSIWVKGSNEDWAICLSHALRRRQYKQVNLRLNREEEDHYHPVENLKSMLEPYEIRLQSTAPEATLISFLQDLPHLNYIYF